MIRREILGRGWTGKRRLRRRIGLTVAIVLLMLHGLARGDEVREGVLRTPDSRFAALADFPYPPNYLEIDDMRIHYVDAGPRDGEIVLLLHGEPTWSYLFRKMIPVFVAAGYRVIAPDLVGFGRSDKYSDEALYSYPMQVDFMQGFVESLDLRNVTFFGQDWGGLIGLRVVAAAPERFARVVVSNTGLPAATGLRATVGYPLFRLGVWWEGGMTLDELRENVTFPRWAAYSYYVEDLPIGELMGFMGGSSDVGEAYMAPFPHPRYKAAAQIMPYLVPSQLSENEDAWQVFESWDKPFLVAFSDSDPITAGGAQAFLSRVPNARNVTIRGAGHFVQEDAGVPLANLMVDFMQGRDLPDEIEADDGLSSPWPGVVLSTIETNGISMRIAQTGIGNDRGTVLLCHGFPESWFSWRHQLTALAAAGYRVIAPDMRGYGETDAPAEAQAYDQVTLAADLAGVLDALGIDRAHIVGHDWGSPAAASTVLYHTDRFSSLALLSVPYGPRSATPPLTNMRAAYGDNFFYMLYHNEPGGVAEAEYDADVRGFLSRLYLSPESPREEPQITDPKRSAGGWMGRLGAAKGLPDWLSQEELDYYVAEFERAGFGGGVNYYRNLNRNWELAGELEDPVIRVPTLFLAGQRDGVIAGASTTGLRALMYQVIPDLRTVHLVPDVGHWVQQEAPQETNRVLLEFLASVEADGGQVGDRGEASAEPSGD